MKFSILALGAAVASISSASQCVAQLQIDSSTPARTADARLVAQNQDFFGDAFTSKSSADSDYSAEEPSQAKSSDPQSIPVGHRSDDPAVHGQTSVADGPSQSAATKPAPMGVLVHTPDISMVPSCWPQNIGCPTPNPVASYMMRGWCTEGIWDTYPCQNAEQCQHIQSHLHGYNRYADACATPACTAPAAPLAPNVPACNCAQVPAKPTTQLVHDRGTQAPAQLPTAKLPTVPVPNVQVPSAQLPFVSANKQIPVALPTGAQAPPARSSRSGASGEVALPAADPLASMSAPSRAVPFVQQSATQPMLQLPANVPTVPAGTYPLPNVGRALPALPLPATVPVIAARPSATLR